MFFPVMILEFALPSSASTASGDSRRSRPSCGNLKSFGSLTPASRAGTAGAASNLTKAQRLRSALERLERPAQNRRSARLEPALQNAGVDRTEIHRVFRIAVGEVFRVKARKFSEHTGLRFGAGDKHRGG